MENKDIEFSNEKDFKEMQIKLFPLIYLIMSIPELVSFFHTEDFFEENQHFLISIQEIMDTVRKLNSVVYQTQDKYKGKTIENSHCLKLAQIKEIVTRKTSVEIIQYFFETLHCYLTSSEYSKHQKCNDSSCLAHQLFNIRETQVKIDGGKQNPVEVNEPLYYLNSTLFSSKSKLKHLQNREENELIETSDLDTNKYLLFWIFYPNIPKEDKEKKASFIKKINELLNENISSKDLVDVIENQKQFGFNIIGAVYEQQTTGECSLVLKEKKLQGWLKYDNNTIKNAFFQSNINGIINKFTDQSKPIMLIAERKQNETSNIVLIKN